MRYLVRKLMNYNLMKKILKYIHIRQNGYQLLLKLYKLQSMLAFYQTKNYTIVLFETSSIGSLFRPTNHSLYEYAIQNRSYKYYEF